MSLVVLATLAVGYTLWAAQDIILPVLLAMFFALVGNPILRLLQKLWIPRALGALLILGAGLGVTGSLAVQLIGPAMEWAQEAPQQLRRWPRAGPDRRCSRPTRRRKTSPAWPAVTATTRCR